jgi:hypothetical protein
LARALGICCDSLSAVDLVDTQAKPITTGATDQPDLLWACRGGGGGSFGVATRFTFQAYPLPEVLTFKTSWLLPADSAYRVFKAWQSWAPHAPPEITAGLSLRRSDKSLLIRCGGWSTGTRAQLNTELNALLDVEKPSGTVNVERVPFLSAVDICSGECQYPSTYLKGKSDVIFAPLDDDGIRTLLDGILSFAGENFHVICDPYGGAISRVAAGDTAFPYRDGTLYTIQYHDSWTEEGLSAERLAEMRVLYASMRRFVSGAAYVNYCDLDLPDWQTAYWGANLPRLARVKAVFDPENVFRHRQGVSPG